MPNKDIDTRLYESVIATAQSAVNYGFLLNGSASVGILTFMGTDNGHDLRQALARSLTVFSVGVALASFASILLYTTQLSYYKQSQGEVRPFKISGTTLRILYLVVVTLSLLSFCAGIAVTSWSVESN
jgi:hypothetical protein